MRSQCIFCHDVDDQATTGDGMAMSRRHLPWAFATWIVGSATLLVVGCGKRRVDTTSPTAGYDARATRPLAGPAPAEEVGAGPSVVVGGWPDAGDPVQSTASGLQMVVLHRGTGTDHAATSDRVRVHFTGWTKDGTIFDSSLPSGKPGLFTLTQVIPGWTEALELMVVGEKRKLWIPAKLAYGNDTSSGEPVGDLTYEIELEEIIHAPKRPDDVAAVPKNATVTPSGLAYRVLSRGTGKVRVKASDTVVASYSGWTTDGLLFDSSRLRDGPGTFTMAALIQGWKEALELMVVGDQMRFWMPANLAYGDHPKNEDAPAGMLVFDIELLQIR